MVLVRQDALIYQSHLQVIGQNSAEKLLTLASDYPRWSTTREKGVSGFSLEIIYLKKKNFPLGPFDGSVIENLPYFYPSGQEFALKRNLARRGGANQAEGGSRPAEQGAERREGGRVSECH